MSDKKDTFICGVVEGFYGRPWTTEQRINLFAKLKKWGMDTYLYAPKDDYKHRAHWRELYYPEEAEHLSSLIAEAKKNGINFYYALSPGLDITYSSEKELKALKRKLDQVQSFGCECYALLFDDIETEMCSPDKEIFQSFANAQVGVTNEIYNHLNCPRFLFCPTQYCSSRASPTVTESEYLKTLGEKLLNDICILWTGKNVISKLITQIEIEEITEVLKRKPVIWDNLHANDYDARRVFLGPYSGRDPNLIPFLRGVVTNPNCEFHANNVAIMTLAIWSKCETEAKNFSPDVKLEIGNENYTDKTSETTNEKCYHGRSALKKAIKEWQYEFTIKKEAPQRPMGKPQPMALPIPIPSLNTCLAMTTPSNTTTMATSSVNDPEINNYFGNETMETTTTTTTAIINYNTLASPTKVMPIICDGTFPVSSIPNLPIMSVKVFESQIEEKCNDAENLNQSKIEEDGQSLEEAKKEIDIDEGEKMLVDGVEKPLEEMMDCGGTPKHVSKVLADDVIMTSSFEPSMQMDSNNDIINDTIQTLESTEMMTVEDIGLLCDLFYLPFEHGEQALTLLQEFNFLKSNARILNKKVGTSSTAIEEWNRRSEQFFELCDQIKNLTRKLARCPNKEICYDLFSYAWDITSVLAVQCAYIRWLSQGHFPDTFPANFSDANFTWFSKSWQDAFTSGNQEPWTLRGGLINDLQKLIPIDPGNSDLFCYKLPNSPDVELYTIRPYQICDENIVYKICQDRSCPELYPENLFSDRFVGPFLTLSPELVLVLEDSHNVICGYCCVALDATLFHRNQEMCWLPEMREKYPESCMLDTNLSQQAKDIIKYFHNFTYESPEVVRQYHPSIIEMSILNDKLQKDVNVSKLLLTVALSLLRSFGSFGANAMVNREDVTLKDFYTTLGFIEIANDDVNNHILYLGRNF